MKNNIQDIKFTNVIKDYILILENESNKLKDKLMSNEVTEDDLALFSRNVTTLQILLRSFVQWNSMCCDFPDTIISESFGENV